MKLLELQQILRAADPAAVLVSPRVLERVIQEICKLPNLFWAVPHRQSYVVDRQILFRHVEQEELELESDQLLPPTVLLLARPTFEELSAGETEALLLKYWQRLFHAKIHAALGERYTCGQLTLADIRDRIEQIGQVEFEEIRSVLTHDQYLLPEADERGVYVEFAAVYYDLRYFAPDLLPVYFPGLRDLACVEAVLRRDVDADALFHQTRLAGAPDPSTRHAEARPDESQEFYWKLVQSSERAARHGNLVRAAILRMRAARVAPGPLQFGTRAEAVQFLQRLAGRLQNALQLTDADVSEWMKDLPALLDKADQGAYPVEAALLFDLQKTCLDFERDIYALDLVEWALSAGRKPIKRPLPSQRSVLVIKHLRAAAQRLTLARLSDADRQHFGSLLQSALQGCEERLRAKFRPVLATALHDVGLQPTNAPERTAFNKLIEEILDRITEHGYLTYGDLRDAISRNQLKLRDLADPQEFIRGDPLLRLDRRLATLLDGVYRPSEIYLRLLERTTALSFGTATGRWLTRFVLLPFGGAWVVLELVLLILGFFLGPSTALAFPPDALAAGRVAVVAPIRAAVPVVEPEEALIRPIIFYPLVVALGFFLLAVLHHAGFRRKCRRALFKAGRALRIVLIDWPIRLVQIPALKQIFGSWSFQLLYWYILKPAALCLLLWFWWPEPFETWLGAAGIFALAYLMLNSRLGYAASEAANQGLHRSFELLRAGLIPGLIHLVTRVFKQVTDAVEHFLFTIDEWLWFRSGESRTSLVVRTILGLLWFPIAYAARFFMVVLIEPGYNPLKAPISILAAKFMLPVTGALTLWLNGTLEGWPTGLGVLVFTLGFLIIVHLPDVFGFIVWEMKESWSLYAANRPRSLRPVILGSHGETVRRLLRPGFHSGTVPKLFTRLRKAERRARVTGNWRRSRACRRALHEVEDAFRQFVIRELVYLLNQSRSWQGQGLEVGQVELASNRISVELALAGHPDRAVWLDFEECAGWMVAHVRDVGWLARLSEEQALALNTALAALYKLAAVDLVREQLQANLPRAGDRGQEPERAEPRPEERDGTPEKPALEPRSLEEAIKEAETHLAIGPPPPVPRPSAVTCPPSPVPNYDITRTGLAVWLDRRHGTAIHYHLVDEARLVTPHRADGEPAPDWPTVELPRLMFGAIVLSWEHLVSSWQKDSEGQPHPRLVCHGFEVDLISPARPFPAGRRGEEAAG